MAPCHSFFWLFPRNSQLAVEFSNCCADVKLPELLQRFSLPISLGDVKKFHNVITGLNKILYVYKVNMYM